MSYEIITSPNEYLLITTVSRYVKDGYIPVGSPFFSKDFGDDSGSFCQAVYKPPVADESEEE